MAAKDYTTLEVDGREGRLSSPAKVRFKDGITGDFVFQKRIPEKRPEWTQTATVAFPSGMGLATDSGPRS
jgi:DNA primase